MEEGLLGELLLPCTLAGRFFPLGGADVSSYLGADMRLPVCGPLEGLVWRRDVSARPPPEIFAFSTLGFRALLFFRAEASAIPVVGRLGFASSSSWLLGGADEGCGMWDVGWLAGWIAGWRPTEITFPPDRKSKHSQSAVCAAHPRSPTAALKPI